MNIEQVYSIYLNVSTRNGCSSCLLSVPSDTLEPRVVRDGDLLAQVDEHDDDLRLLLRLRSNLRDHNCLHPSKGQVAEDI